jgi:hypothetical protein
MEASQQKVFKSKALFGLTENGFNRLPAFGVDALSPFGEQFPVHSFPLG